MPNASVPRLWYIEHRVEENDTAQKSHAAQESHAARDKASNEGSHSRPHIPGDGPIFRIVQGTKKTCGTPPQAFLNLNLNLSLSPSPSLPLKQLLELPVLVAG
jgi:hypothetical protein